MSSSGTKWERKYKKWMERLPEITTESENDDPQKPRPKTLQQFNKWVLNVSWLRLLEYGYTKEDDNGCWWREYVLRRVHDYVRLVSRCRWCTAEEISSIDFCALERHIIPDAIYRFLSWKKHI